MKVRNHNCVALLAGLLVFEFALVYSASADTHLRINAGGPTVGAWQADGSYASGGAGFPFRGDHDVSEVHEPAPNEVYQTVRHLDHRYNFPKLGNGEYVVRLHFTDAFRSRERAMDYRIEGKIVIDDLCVYEAAGKRTNHVFVRDIPVRVEDGNGLQIECSKDGGNDVFEAAIEILSASSYERLIEGQPVAIVRKTAPKATPAPEPPPAPAPAPVSVAPETKPVADEDVRDRTSRELLELTGGRRVRLVWSEVSSPGDLMVTNERSTLLYGLDTAEDTGPRLILEEKDGYSKPILSPAGDRILYTNQKKGRCYIVNWDGKGREEFAKGFASDCWRDPATGVEWVFVRNSIGNSNGAMVRRRLDNPDIVETVWDKSPVGNATVPWFRLSADGRVAADAFPWPKCGIADMEKKTWQMRGNGCWTSIAPDNSYRFFHFMGNHVQLAMFDPGATKPRMIPVNTMEGVGGKKVYHPRWSSDPRFITMTGPQRSSRSELYLGRFDTDFTRVEKWVRITHDKRADYYGAAWIEPSPRPRVPALVARPVMINASKPVPSEPESEAPAVAADAEWPGSHRGLVFLWENNLSENQVLDEKGALVRICSGELRGQSRFTRHYALDLRRGSFEVDRIEKSLLEAARASNELTIEATLTATKAEQNGPARILSFSSGSNSRNFTLGQEGRQLVLRLRTPSTGENGSPPEVSLGEIVADKPTHVLVRYRAGRLEAFINGKPSLSTDAVQGGFENWTAQELVFGDEVGGGRNWEGTLEGVAIYNRSLGDDEVRWHHENYMARFDERQPADRLVVEAELLEVSRVPEISQIGSYRRSIVHNLYRIRKVISGKAPAEKRIVVTEWGVLDRQPVAGAPGKVGDVRELTLEPFNQHPELASDWPQNDLSVFDLQVYHRIDP